MCKSEPKVDFVLAGAQKSGTRAVRHFLSSHPEIGLMSPPKIEGHFFDKDIYFKNAPDYDTYHSWFAPEELGKMAADITPIYTYWPQSIERIRTYNPQMKFIVLLRNPVERAFSHWNMEFSRGDEQDQFATAILREPFRRGLFQYHRVYSYLHRGFYSVQIKRLFSYFPREQCLILKSEQLRDNHFSAITSIYDFLAVKTDKLPAPRFVHAAEYTTSMPSALRSMLALYYRRDIRRLERILEWNCKDWISDSNP